MQRSGQIVAIAPSWVANSSITEAETRRLEPNEKIWSREYAAIPQASLSSAFDPDSVARAFRVAPYPAHAAEAVCIVDASSGGGDAFTWAIARYETPSVSGIERYLTRKVPRFANVRIDGVERLVEQPGESVPQAVFDAAGRQVENPEWHSASRPALVFREIGSFEGRFAGSIAGSEIVQQIAGRCHAWHAKLMIGDQRESFFLGSEAQRHDLRFVPLTWTNANKIEAVTRIKRMLAGDGQRSDIVLPPEREKLKRELLNYAERVTASGSITYSARGSGHDDEAALLITCALGELERLIPGSPVYHSNARHLASGRSPPRGFPMRQRFDQPAAVSPAAFQIICSHFADGVAPVSAEEWEAAMLPAQHYGVHLGPPPTPVTQHWQAMRQTNPDAAARYRTKFSDRISRETRLSARWAGLCQSWINGPTPAEQAETERQARERAAREQAVEARTQSLLAADEQKRVAAARVKARQELGQ